MMKSPSASEWKVIGPRMRSSTTTSPSGTASRIAAGSPAAIRLVDLVGAQPAAATVVARHAAGRERLGTQPPRGARRCRSSGRRARRREAVRPPPVALAPLALPVRRRTGRRRRALRPSRARASAGRRGSTLRCAVFGARRVGVLDCARRSAAAVARVEEVEQRRARRADVERARGARREAYSHRLVEGYGSAFRWLRLTSSAVYHAAAAAACRGVAPTPAPGRAPRTAGRLVADLRSPAARWRPAVTPTDALAPHRVPDRQRTTPYADAVLRYRERDYVQFHTPGHKQGKGAPAVMREIFGMPLLRRRRGHGRRHRGRARVDAPRAGGRGARRRGVGRRALLVPGQRLDERRPRAAAHAGGAGRHGDRAAQRAQVAARGADLLGRHAALRRADRRPRVGHPAQRPDRALRRRGRRAPRRQGPLLRLAQLQRPLRRPADGWQSSRTTPACRSSSTRPGGHTCASATGCRSTP